MDNPEFLTVEKGGQKWGGRKVTYNYVFCGFFTT